MTDQANKLLRELPVVNPALIATWEAFQLWVKAWNEYNFPNKKPYQPLLGVVEECCGELWSALEQPLTSDDEVYEYYDAIGDTLVYLADYCNNNGLDMLGCVQRFEPRPWDTQASTRALEALSVYCGQLCHAHLKMEQRIRGNEKHFANKEKAVGAIVFHLGRLPNLPCYVFKIAINTFTEVAKRDWIKYPENGLPPIDLAPFETGRLASSEKVCCVCGREHDQLTVVGPGLYKCPACLFARVETLPDQVVGTAVATRKSETVEVLFQEAQQVGCEHCGSMLHSSTEHQYE